MFLNGWIHEYYEHFNASWILDLIIRAMRTSSTSMLQYFGAQFLIKIATYYIHQLNSCEVSTLVISLVNSVMFLPKMDTEHGREINIMAWNTIDSLASYVYSFDCDNICKTAMKFLTTTGVYDGFQTRALHVLVTLVRDSEPGDLLNVGVNAARLMEILELSFRWHIAGFQTIHWCFDAIRILEHLTCWKEFCIEIVKNGGIGILIGYIEMFDNELFHIKILTVLLAICDRLEYKDLKIFFADCTYVFLERMLNKWNDDRGYYVWTILTFLVANADKNQVELPFCDSANQLILERVPTHLTDQIREYLANYSLRTKFRKIVSLSKRDGPIFWVLVSMKKFVEQNTDRESFIFTFTQGLFNDEIRKLETKSTIVKSVRDELITLFELSP